MAMGRPQKPYTCSWLGRDGKHPTISGLYKWPDGRWRINATGRKFTEPDERRAVQRFLDWTTQNDPEALVSLPLDPMNIPEIQPVVTLELPDLKEQAIQVQQARVVQWATDRG